MIMCDIQGENCYKWYHGMCVGISPEQGRYMEKHNELFKCPSCAGVPALPTFVSANVTNFIWGSSLVGSEFCDCISAAYDQVVHWRNNLFMVPFGKVGTNFVTELSKLFQNYGTASAMECIALKAAMVIPPLLLQRPHQNPKSHDHVICLERRLSLWRDGNIILLDLLNEGCSIQHHLQTNKGERPNFEDTANLLNLCQGKVKIALRFVSDKSRGSFLPVSAQIWESTVLEKLIKKHPSPSSVSSSNLIVSDSTNFDHCHPAIFDCLTDEVIQKVVLRMDGAAGPSGVDARGWRRLCTSFRSASVDLCRSLALTDQYILCGLCCFTTFT